MIFSKSTLFTTSGSFIVPSTVSLVLVTSVGGGCGGGSRGIFASSGAGGAGESVINFPLPVTPSSTLTVTVGAGGVGAAGGSHQSGAKGTNSSVAGGLSLGTYVALAAPNQNTSFPSDTNVGGSGGGPGGYDTLGGAQTGHLGMQESPSHFGGSSGGAAYNGSIPPGDFTTGGSSGGVAGGVGGGPGIVSNGGGGGGGSSPWGQGGNGGTDDNVSPATAGNGNGSGGGGAANTNAGGNGTKGYVLIQWAA